MEINPNENSTLKFGFYISIILSVLTFLALVLGMMAIPPAGPNCPKDCMEYPYLDLLKYFPRDYFWMYIASFQLIAFLVFIITVNHTSLIAKKLFGLVSVVFAMISTTVLLLVYYVQYAVVPISVMKGELEGIALITQYNGHGIFIAMEELGYWLMSISLFFLAFALPYNSRMERSVRFLLIIPLILSLTGFIFYTLRYGIDRDYRFEVVTLTANWLVLVVAGILLAIVFKRKMIVGNSTEESLD